jgi:UDP-N-acetyl-D-mannosaminuronate dehydrogenase
MEQMNDLTIGVLGYGEVGKAVASFYEKPFIKDLDRDEFPDAGQLDVLHVCIPAKAGAEQFAAHVLPVIQKHCPGGLVIIHSTVPVGTTALIAKDHKMTVHSPVRGVHPDLALGIKIFVKYVGTDSSAAGLAASEHLTKVGMGPVKVLHKSTSTETLKLLDTTYYGLCIAFHAYAEKICQELGISSNMVMYHANLSYNLGYEILGKPNVVRPVLYPPEDGKIGGHCVIPNAEILKKQFGDDPILEAILRHQ